MKTATKTTRAAQLAAPSIAKRHIGIESLETMNSGDDFHEVSVWELRAALEAAFLAGAALANK